MSEALMKKAWEEFGGVWPDGVDIVITTSKKWLGSDRYVGIFRGAWYNEDGVISAKALEDTGISTPSMNENDGWIVVFKNKEEFEACGASLKKEWVPEFGEECEIIFTDDDKPEWVPIHFFGLIDERPVIFDLELKKRAWCDSKAFELRPIKTEREKFVDEFVNDSLIRKDELAVRAIAESMFDLGYRKND